MSTKKKIKLESDTSGIIASKIIIGYNGKRYAPVSQIARTTLASYIQNAGMFLKELPTKSCATCKSNTICSGANCPWLKVTPNDTCAMICENYVKK